MKKLIQPMLRILAFFLGLLVVFSLTSLIFLPKDNTEEAGMDQLTANGILAEPDHSLDLIIVGDSESYCAFSPMLMWKDYGFTSYVYGTSGQRMYETLRYVKQFLKNQKPEMLILEVNAVYRASSIKNVVASLGETVFPLIQYHNRWKNMSLRDFTGPVKYTQISHMKGYHYKTGISAGILPDYMAYTEEVMPISKINELCLDQILKVCRQKEIPVLFVSAPSMDNWSYAKHNGIQQYADRNGIEYYDMNLMNEEIGVDWDYDTLDKGDHLNHHGTIKVSDYFGNYIQKKLGLPDHRQDPDFSSWHLCWEQYAEETGLNH